MNGTGAGPHGSRPAATQRQLEAIVKIGRAEGLEPAAVESMSLRVFHRKPGALTREEASELIKELTNLKRRRPP